MATDTASSGFADCALLADAIRALTVAQAKALIKDLNNESDIACGHLPLSGNKPEIIARLTSSLTERKNQGDIRGYQKFRSLVLRYKSPTVAATGYRNGAPTSTGAYGAATSAGAYVGGQRLGGIPANKIASSSYSPLATAAAPVSRPIGSAGTVRINFRTSPFYEIKQFVSPIVQCPEAPTQTDRRNATLFVTFTGEQAEQLRSASHQLRLFCTTVEAHAASLSGRNPAIIEFPLTCEARVNNTPLSINLRGSKKNIGRVPPPNLNKDHALMLIEGKPNRIDLTYTNAPKRHALVAAICQITSVETLVERLRSKQFRSKEEILSKMRREAEDDEIEAGAATMSLKCPLSYMRIATPCRSINCPHVQCFDAESFFSVNEQTPAWSCPICFKNVRAEDLLMDGYVDDILKRVPHDADSVIVEPDGSWRTADGKVNSGGTGQATPAAVGTPIQDRLGSRDSEDVKPGPSGSGKQNGTRKHSPTEIVLLDSPSPEPESAPNAPPAASSSAQLAAASSSATGDQQLRNGATSASTTAPHHTIATASAAAPRLERIEILSSSTNTSARQSPAIGAGNIIDLTLDSDEDDEPSVPTRAAPSNGAQYHASNNNSSNTSNGSSMIAGQNSGSRSGFSAYATPHRAAGLASAGMRVDATPEDEQIRRPGKRPRTDAPTDPRLVNGRRSSTNTNNSNAHGDEQRSLPASYLDVGTNGGGNAASSRTNGTADEASTRAAGAVAGGRTSTTGGEEGDDSWIDNSTHDHDQYLNEDDWWSTGS